MRLLGAGLLVLIASLTHAAEEPVTLAQRVQGLTRQDGFLPLYWDAQKGQLLMEVARPGELFLYAVGLAGGAGVPEVDLDRGTLGEAALCRFERVGPRVLLHRLQTTHTSGVGDAERTRAVAESFPSAILAALPIVAEEKGRLLVDATDLVLRDTVVLRALRGAGAGSFTQDVSRSALRVERTGAFPRNTEAEAALTFAADDASPALRAALPDGRTMTLLVHHSFLALPDGGYEPLRADPRVGIFSVAVKDLSAPFTEPLERYLVTRWRLVKKDPSAAVSEPVQPIVLHLDRGMPEPERTAVARAALWWNRAFLEAGFKDALVLRDLPEGATFLDARYSGIEWVHRAERGWSVGEFRADPRTGEILHGVARIDSHRRRTTSRMWRNLSDPAQPIDPGGEREFVMRRLAYLSAHEVGHVLGVDHNWAATTFGWGSVMDYLAANVQLRDGKLDVSDPYATDIGPYDVFAIRWAYGAGQDAAARAALISAAEAAGVFFPLTADARWAEYDHGSDPVEWLRTTLDVRRVILGRFGRAQVGPDEPVASLHERLSLAYLYHRFGIQAAQQHVGGQYQRGAVGPTGTPAAQPVPDPRQVRALDLLLECLVPGNLDLPDTVIQELTATPSGHWTTRERFPSEAGPAFSLFTAARALSDLVIRPLLQPEVAARLTLPSVPQASSGLRTVLTRLNRATWGAPRASSPRLRGLQRVAQRSYLDALLDLHAAPEATPEVRALVLAELLALRQSLEARSPAASADADTAAHRRLAARDVEEALDDPQQRARRRPPVAAPQGRPIGAGPGPQ
jgi:hypothetical protein